MTYTELINTTIPYVQNFPGRGGIDYSTWEDVTLYDCLFGSKAQAFKEKNEYFRANFSKEKDKNAYSNWKVSNGRMFYPGIICKDHRVNRNSIAAPTGIMSIDVDKQDNPRLFADPELLDVTIRNIQAWVPYLFAMTKSIGEGYVFYAYVDVPGNEYDEWERNNKIIYEKVKQDFLKFGVVIDAVCGNLNRGRFISYDGNPWVNEGVEILSLDASEFSQSNTYNQQKSDDDLDSHVAVTGYSIDGFTITKPMNYQDWWKVWKNMEYAFGHEAAQDEFWKFCQALEKANNSHPDWPHNHPAKHIFKNATAKYECKKWKLDVGLLKSIGYKLDIKCENDKITLRDSVENNINIVPEGKWLNDYAQEILTFWNEHPTMMLVGNTGLGKTEMIKQISHTEKVVVVVPYNDMLTIYAHGDVVPGISEIIDSGNVRDFEAGKSVCIIWDQLPKIINKLDGYSIIVDECHVVGKSIFRHSSTNLSVILKDMIDMGKKVMFVTATPTFEQEVYGFGVNDIMMFDRQGYIRPVEVCYGFNDEYDGKMMPGKASSRIKGDVLYNQKTGRFDYVLIWSDRYNKVLSDHFRLNHIDTYQVNKNVSEHNEDVRKNIEELKSTQMLNKGVYTFTQLTENGFNFKNTEGKALVIIHVNKYDFSSAKIIQIIGRLRFIPYVYVKVYVEGEIEHELDAMDKYVRARMHEAYDMQTSNDPLYSDINVVDVEIRNAEYEKIHGTPEQLKEDMEKYLMGGRFNVRLNDMSEKKGFKRLNNNTKREDEKIAWGEIKQGITPTTVYGKMLYYTTIHLGEQYGKDEIIRWVDLLLGKAKSDKLVSTCLQELQDNLPWTDQQWSKNQQEIISKVLESKKHQDKEKGEVLELSDRLIKHIWKDMKDHIRWAEKYKDCINIKEMVCVSEAVVASEIEDLFEKRSVAHSVKHKEHKKKLLRVVSDGFVGDRQACAEHLEVNVKYITELKKKGLVVSC